MVNVSGRSKGCSTCRRRKIKCDESFPECLQCKKAGLCCPGARTGAFFVHALPERPLSRSSAKRRPLNSKCEPILSPSSHGTTSPTPSPSPLSLQQPGRADIFDQLFVSHFIESFGFRASVSVSPSPTWLDKLSVFIVSPVPDLVKHSIRAGSMFFYGTLAQDVAIRTEACKWYMRALQGLQDVLSQNASPFTGDVICAAVMLTHFESLAGTSEGAWYQHVQGASMMLETGGPESCRDGFLHQLFRHLRLLTFAASFVKNEGHVFSTPEWKSVPFELHPKGPFDYLVDILFSLLSCLTVADELIKAHGDKADAVRQRLKTLVLGLISQLHIWWKGCISMANIGEPNPERWMEATSEDPESRCLDPHYFPILPHSDMPTAALFALYDSANIIALRLLFLVSSSAYLYEERIQRHAHSILSAKAFISAIPDPTSSRGSIMVGFPFKILSIWSPPGREESPQDKQSASSSTTSTELFANIAAYVLRLHKPELLAEGLGHKIIA